MITIPANETNSLSDGLAYHREIPVETVTLAQVAEFGARISRVRLLTEFDPRSGKRIADISYIHASRDGRVRRVQVDCPSIGLNLYGRDRNAVKQVFIAWAQEQGVSALALGLLDESNWSIVR